MARAQVKPPAFEAEAVARPDVVIHPVDLGTIFVPADWLLLAGGQTGRGARWRRSVAAPMSRNASLIAWYESAPDQQVKTGSGFAPRVAKWPGPAGAGPRRQDAEAGCPARGHRGR